MSFLRPGVNDQHKLNCSISHFPCSFSTFIIYFSLFLQFFDFYHVFFTFFVVSQFGSVGLADLLPTKMFVRGLFKQMLLSMHITQ